MSRSAAPNLRVDAGSTELRDGGFTLVEMLVSLALLAMAAVLIGRSFVLDRAALWRVQAHASAGERVEAAQNAIRSRLEHLFAEASYDGQSPTIAMDGAPDRLTFLAPGNDPRTPIRRYQLALSPGSDLTLATGDKAAAALPPPGDAAILLPKVDRLQIDYFGPAGVAGAPAWVGSWMGRSAPPRLVRIRLVLPASDRRIWPELIVRPAVSVDNGCVIDPDTGACRGRP
jgi:general secretion pathway protein J